MDVADEPTCGKGLAHNAAVPAAMGAVAALLARNLELHMAALDRADEASEREHGLYERLAERLRSAAAGLEAAGEEMAGARDLPMGRHDMAAMTRPEVLDAFERHLAAEDDLRALLAARGEGNRQMLAAMREAIGAAGR
jgi:hypothetical protein